MYCLRHLDGRIVSGDNLLYIHLNLGTVYCLRHMDGKIVSGDNLMFVALSLRYIVLSTTHGWKDCLR